MVSSPDGGVRSRPLRVAGLALLGVAVGAALVGIVSLGGGDGQNAAPPSTSAPASETAPPGDTTAQQTTGATEQPPATSAPSTQTPVPTSASQQPPAQPPPDPRAPVRVYNNGTIAGLAAQAADDFRRNGWVVESVDNYSAGVIPTSTVYFQPGTNEEAAARALAARFNLRVEPRFEGIAPAKAGLIVIVTNDYGSK